MKVPIDWQAEISIATKRYPIVFVHIGRARLPAQESLAAVGWVISIAEYLSEGSLPKENEGAVHSSVVVISDVETVIGSRRHTLGALRERVMADVDEGHRFVLQSRVARTAFPEAPGSNLLADAKQVFVPILPNDEADGVERLPGWNCERSQESSGDSSTDKVKFLSECVEELSMDTVSHLSELLWDSRQSPNEVLESISSVGLESMLSCGLVSMDNGGPVWVIASEWKYFREAVAAISSRYASENPWLAQTFVDLWLIERRLRNVFRDALIAIQGRGWRSTCLPAELRAEVLGRAQRDSQPSAGVISDLRDPLEWLSTSELLDLRTQESLGKLGLEAHQWKRLREVLIPVRNRAAHMRIIGELDARNASTWRKLVEQKVST